MRKRLPWPTPHPSPLPTYPPASQPACTDRILYTCNLHGTRGPRVLWESHLIAGHSPEKAIDRELQLQLQLGTSMWINYVWMRGGDRGSERETKKDTKAGKRVRASCEGHLGAGFGSPSLCSLEKWMINYEITSVNAFMKGDCIVQDNLLVS